MRVLLRRGPSTSRHHTNIHWDGDERRSADAIAKLGRVIRRLDHRGYYDSEYRFGSYPIGSLQGMDGTSGHLRWDIQ